MGKLGNILTICLTALITTAICSENSYKNNEQYLILNENLSVDEQEQLFELLNNTSSYDNAAYTENSSDMNYKNIKIIGPFEISDANINDEEMPENSISVISENVISNSEAEQEVLKILNNEQSISSENTSSNFKGYIIKVEHDGLFERLLKELKDIPETITDYFN